MKLSLGTRLTLSYLIVILTGMGIAIALTWLTVERLYLILQRANLLVLAHGGRTAASSVEGQGTTVTVWLPAAKADTRLPSS